MTRNGLNRMLINNGSSINILFGTTNDKMSTSQELTLVTTLLHSFTVNAVPRRKIMLAVKMVQPPLRLII